MSFVERDFELLENTLGDHPTIISKLKEYIEIILVADTLTKEKTISINKSQFGITICHGSMAFRILKNKKKFLIINFVNFRNWERVIPIGAKNHFRIKGACYDHSFSFNNEKDFLLFFDRYIFSPKGLSCIFKK